MVKYPKLTFSSVDIDGDSTAVLDRDALYVYGAVQGNRVGLIW